MRDFIGLILLSCCVAWAPPRAGSGHPGEPADDLRTKLRTHLGDGRLDAALREARAFLARFPEDADVRREFVSLLLSFAREMMREERFSAAEQACRAVLKVDAAQREARRLVGILEKARRTVPRRVEQARRWIEIEWFEPAFVALRQAGALVPDDKQRWAAAYRAAAVGAGDDHYFTKNFHEASYYYDAALKLGDESDMKPSASLISRSLQSMVFALAADAGRVRYPPIYWRRILRRAEHSAAEAGQSSMFRAMLRGLAYDNQGDPQRAAIEYGKVLGRPVVSLDEGLIARSRAAARDSLRRWYDVGLSERRQGIWDRAEPGDWQLLEVPRFRIHHHNPAAARRVAAALRFHFNRIAGLLGRDPEAVPWPVPCDVYLHVDGDAFRSATGQAEPVRAISVVRKLGEALHGHRIHVSQTDPMLLSTSLGHELAHLMVSAVVGGASFKPVLNEGIALHVEPQCRHRQFARLFRLDRKPRTIGSLLAVEEVHPPEPGYYAEAYRLLDVLLSRGDMNTALAAGQSAGNRRELALSFGFESGSSLERRYRGGTD